MGNLGTTPSWDDEQIAKYGLFEHFDMVSRPFRTAQRRRNTALVEEHLNDVLELLPSPDEETRARVSFAIPNVINCLTVVDVGVARENWHYFLAEDVYEDSLRRSGMVGPFLLFEFLPEEKRLPFLDLISTIIALLRIKASRT